jgi:hypothetical protein
MKLSLFACGLVIVLLSKGALAQPRIDAASVDMHPAVATVALIPFLPGDDVVHPSRR